MSNVHERQNVVVVGGGGTGAFVIQNLSAKLDPSKYNLILITPRPYFLHLIGTIRMVVTSEGKLEERNAIPLDRCFANGNGTLHIGTVVSISDNREKGGHVTLADGKTVDYSILVLTPGSSWDGPLAMPDGKAELAQWSKNWRSKFEKAEDVLLVGGGAVGIEFAGEIKEFYPHKKVTIVHGQDLLLNNTYPDKWRKDVEQRLRRRGVNLVMGDIVPSDALASEGGSVKTRNGKTITTDLIVPTRGPRPNTSFIGASLSEHTLTPDGRVKIFPTFQLQAHPRIFAGGDITDWPEQKQAGKYYKHADIISANVLSLLADQKPTVMYKGAYEMIVVTIGKTGGAAYFGVLWGLMFGDWVSSMLKSKDLVVSMVRKKLRYSD